MSGPEAWQDAERIICARLDSMGDVLMTSPAIRAIREASPGRSIALITSRSGAEAARLIPEIDEIITYDAPWMKAPRPHTDSSRDLRTVELIRAGRFDAAVVFTVYSQNPLPAAFLFYLAGVPLRTAYCRENPYHLLTDWRKEPEPENGIRHEVQRQLDLAASIGCTSADRRLSIRVPREAEEEADRALRREVSATGRPFIVVHPGASAASRRYPAELFAEAADRLSAGGRYAIAFTGTAEERPLVAGIQGMMRSPSASLAGRLSLAALAAVLSRARLLISNNTGPVHLACSVGTNVVDLYALTNPQHTPWGVSSRVLYHDVPCRYCYKSVCPEGHNDCLRRIVPDRVVRAAEELLSAPFPAIRDMRAGQEGLLPSVHRQTPCS